MQKQHMKVSEWLLVLAISLNDAVIPEIVLSSFWGVQLNKHGDQADEYSRCRIKWWFEMGLKNECFLKTLSEVPKVWSSYVWVLWVYRIEKPKALSLMLHTADISHPAKAWDLHHRWIMSLLEEFFRQVPCHAFPQGCHHWAFSEFYVSAMLW